MPPTRTRQASRQREVALLLPVLNRPARVVPLLESIDATSDWINLRPLFIVSPADRAEKAAILNAGLDWLQVGWEPGPGDYARKINFGLAHARDAGYRVAFLGADDLSFHPGWIEHAIAAQVRSGACVVGTNDLGNSRVVSGKHSTHSLVHLDYLECGSVDDPDLLLHEGYDHNYVDDEFVQTAICRGTFEFARDSIVEHLHPDWSKGPLDTTYEKGKARFSDDHDLYERRKHLWFGGRPRR